jgi:hypothetical protein
MHDRQSCGELCYPINTYVCATLHRQRNSSTSPKRSSLDSMRFVTKKMNSVELEELNLFTFEKEDLGR